MNQRVIFISEIKDPDSQDFSSTQIMTNNLLSGLKAVADSVFFLALIDANSSSKAVEAYYSQLADEVYVLKSHLNLTLTKGKFTHLKKVLGSWLWSAQYENELAPLFSKIASYNIILTHSPALEALSIGRVLKRESKLKWIQYWSDPYTLAGICPEDITYKRTIHWLLEYSMLRFADEVVYGTKTLMQFQQRLFQRWRGKMRYVDVSYCQGSRHVCGHTAGNSLRFIYAGNYNPLVRDIVPLYQAFCQTSDRDLTVLGNGAVNLTEKANITISERVSYQEAERIESESDVIICLLNRNCIQIPGKLFYRVNTDQPILVIADGMHKQEIVEYLSTFHRFVFCDNTVESIVEAINDDTRFHSLTSDDLSKIRAILSPAKVASDLLKIKTQDEKL